ncbi:hypothetical protein H7X68_02440 [Candidatus Saccharibacteria bacterium]|nr:hypothetical protein [Candidatus Saccharibacteria bacterium]
MAEDQYDRIVAKAKMSGVSSLSKDERAKFEKVTHEVSHRGSKSRDIRDGKK